MTQPKQLLIFKRMKSVKGSMETKVFCKGSEEFKKVINKLINDKIVSTSHFICSEKPDFFTSPSRYFALSTHAESDNIPNKLGYTNTREYYPSYGYIEVSPQEFDKWWREHFGNKEVKNINSEISIIIPKLELSKKSPLKIFL